MMLDQRIKADMEILQIKVEPVTVTEVIELEQRKISVE